VAGERSADEIQRDIEQARVTLAQSVDQLADRTSPKRITNDIKQSVLAKVRTPQGQAILAGTGVVLVIVLVRRHRRSAPNA
jgi:hypothetical protein